MTCDEAMICNAPYFVRVENGHVPYVCGTPHSEGAAFAGQVDGGPSVPFDHPTPEIAIELAQQWAVARARAMPPIEDDAA